MVRMLKWRWNTMKSSKILLAVVVFILLCVGWFLYEKPEQPKPSVAPVLPTINNARLEEKKVGGGLNWELNIDSMSVDAAKQKNILKGIKGKLYRADGSFVEVIAERGEINMLTKDIRLQDKVAVNSSRGEQLTAKELLFESAKELITATGDVVIKQKDTIAKADKAVTGKEMQQLKLIGNASIVKGGE